MVHTGQHYDYDLSRVFLKELSLPEPVANLGVGSDTDTRQTARMMMALEQVIRKLAPDFVLVPGDTNSALASALVAAKARVPFAHLEAGPRNFDLSIQEEVNRIVADHTCTVALAPTPSSVSNLEREGLTKDRVVWCGDTMLDLLLAHLNGARKKPVLNSLSEGRGFVLTTIHRQENVDRKDRLSSIVKSIGSLTKYRFVVPLHPRTRLRLKQFHLWKTLSAAKHVHLLSPVDYETSIALILNASVVMTDSGGLQKESFWLGVPCVTVFKNTAWPETLRGGANRCVEAKVASIGRAIAKASSVRFSSERALSLFGGGRSSARISQVLVNRME